MGQSGGNLDEWEEELEYTQVRYEYTFCNMEEVR